MSPAAWAGREVSHVADNFIAEPHDEIAQLLTPCACGCDDSAVGPANGNASQRSCNVAIGPTSAVGPVRVAQIDARYVGLTLASTAIASSEAPSRPRAARFLKRHAARK